MPREHRPHWKASAVTGNTELGREMPACIAGDPRAGLASRPRAAAGVAAPHRPGVIKPAPRPPSTDSEPRSRRPGAGSGWGPAPGGRGSGVAAAGSARNRLALGMPWRLGLGSKAHNSTLPRAGAVVRRAEEPHWQEPRISTLHCSKAHSGWQPLVHYHRAGRMRASTRVCLHAGTKTTRHVRFRCKTLMSLGTPSSSRPTHRGRRPCARAACRRYASSP